MWEHKRESSFGLTKALMPCNYSDPEALFRGSVDCLFYNDTEHKLILIDYKTGKIPDDKYMSYKQLSWYAIYFFIKYPKLDSIHISYVYIEHENKEYSLLFSRDDLNDLKIELIQNITKIERDNCFAIKSGPLCNYCEYQNHCDNEPAQTPPNSFLTEY